MPLLKFRQLALVSLMALGSGFAEASVISPYTEYGDVNRGVLIELFKAELEKEGLVLGEENTSSEPEASDTDLVFNFAVGGEVRLASALVLKVSSRGTMGSLCIPSCTLHNPYIQTRNEGLKWSVYNAYSAALRRVESEVFARGGTVKHVAS